MENKKENKSVAFINKAESLVENLNKMNTIIANFIKHDLDGDPNLTAENRSAVLSGAIAKIKAFDAEEMSLTRLVPKGYKHSGHVFGSMLQDRVKATEASGAPFGHIADLLNDAIEFVAYANTNPAKYKEEARTELISNLYAAHVGLKSWMYRVMYVIGR